MQVAHHILDGEDVGDTEGRCGRPALRCRCTPYQDGSVDFGELAGDEDSVCGRLVGEREECDECRLGDALKLIGLGESEVR